MLEMLLKVLDVLVRISSLLVATMNLHKGLKSKKDNRPSDKG